MPILDTELLFALSPKDPKHKDALKLVKNLKGIMVPDTSLLEFQMVLRGRGRSISQLRLAMLALSKALLDNHITEAKTIDLKLLILQMEIEQKYLLSFFDSLIAASALLTDREIISDDPDYDKVPSLKRIPIAGFKS